MRGREFELMSMALADLRKLGYDVQCSLGRKVRLLQKNGDRFHALLQVRAYQAHTYRYLVGIVIPELRWVDRVIVWFENERHLLDIPASFLVDILDAREAVGDAAYSTGERQWRVDIHLKERALSPQGTRGLRFDISDYYVERPVAQSLEPAVD